MKNSILVLMASSMIWMMGCGGASETSPINSAAREDSKDRAGWLADFEQAKKIAKERNRPVLVNFTGSDWCPPCIQLKKDILSAEQFTDYADEKLVLLELDFPRRTPQPEELKQQNEELARSFAIEGFPTLLLLSPEGEELARNVGYMPGGPDRFVEWAETARK